MPRALNRGNTAFFKCWIKQFSAFKNLHAEFDEIIITFTVENARQLEIEDKFNLILVINR